MPPSSTINLTVAIRHDSLENSDSDNQYGGSFEISSQVNIYTSTFYNVWKRMSPSCFNLLFFAPTHMFLS